ncbi:MULTISPECIES: hypothetical protein [Spirulina sp. CCY15215]|uniref:hypothetical protein n=1 Tax=Spirulina sp. CCY15215 TaxID=2767591 RepID=UPI00194E78BC|nr:hypothetical protein [Spirulina major]
MRAMLQIHEFSTGIQVEGTPDGGWVSKGFTGDYMNRTLPTIPSGVRDAITNREFAVAEGAYGSDPAIIGREVSGYGEEWSVVAVVTKGKDDRGRSASMYRYFLSQGRGKLEIILAWMNGEKQQGRGIVFDPFNSKREGQPNLYQAKSRTGFQLREDLRGLMSGSAPAIVPCQQPCAPLSLNEMAKQMAHRNGGAIAWAFKVEALEQPRMFQAIQPGSDRAEELLRRTLASQPRLTTPIAGEQAIKNAVKGLMRKVKPESLLALDNALSNSAIDERFWREIFDGQGASKAISQGLYSDQMVKLLTLRGAILPQTLPEFVGWMGSRSGKQDEHWTICAEFQSEILRESNQLLQLNSFREQVLAGARSLIPRVINKPELVSYVAWFLHPNHGIWGYWYRQQVREEINNDLSLMNRFVRQRNTNLDFQTTENLNWKKLLEDIAIFWQGHPRPRKQFESLADLFSQIGTLEMSALFHHISFGEVPGNIFDQLCPTHWDYAIYGIKVKRQVTPIESLAYFLLDIGAIDMKMMFVLPLLAISLTGGVLLGNTVLDLEEKPDSTQSSQNSGTEDSSSTPSKTPPESPSSPTNFASTPTPNDKDSADSPTQFKKTSEAIQKIANDLTSYSKGTHSVEIIQQEIIKILGFAPSENLSLKSLDSPDPNVAKQWVNAIEDYQQRKTLKVDGVINVDGRTSKMLKCDVAQNLKIVVQDCQAVTQPSTYQNGTPISVPPAVENIP